MKTCASGWKAPLWLWLGLAAGCDDATQPSAPKSPSVLLVVMDTTRQDAVSAYGVRDDTTPHFDVLAREGLLFRRAFAPSPWTLPSHASLFTSLGPEGHGVGVAGRTQLPAEFATLAERLRDAGYETVGFSENPLVGQATGLARGFEHFEGEQDAAAIRMQQIEAGFDVVRGVEAWADQRSGRPFFVFVNLFDPHDPYHYREETRLTADDVTPEIRRLMRGSAEKAIAELAGICDRLPTQPTLDALRELYLGEVRRADRKLGSIYETLSDAANGSLLTIVTADHGEHLGEHRLLGHEFSLRTEVLSVPLVVHGLRERGIGPAALEAPVALEDVAPSLLEWLGLEIPKRWSGVQLPLRPTDEADPRHASRALRAVYSDVPLSAPDGYRVEHSVATSRRRRGCQPEDRVFGRILSVIRHPYKVIRYTDQPTQLYDLRWDRREISDLSRLHPDPLRRLEAELDAWETILDRQQPPSEAPSEATLDALRALGYLED